MRITEIRDQVLTIQLSRPETLIQGEILLVKKNIKCYLWSASLTTVHAILFDIGEREIRVGDPVFRTKQTFNVNIPVDIIGRIWNYNLESFELSGGASAMISPTFDLRSLAESTNLNNLEIEPEISYIDSRRNINAPLETGTFMIDTMLPIGKGQRELIIGDRQTGKTSLAIDAIINQKGKEVICIYVGIGKKKQEIVDLYVKLKNHQALNHTIIIAAVAADGPLQLFLAPYVATLVAEQFRNMGKDVLIVYDDLSKHAKAYRSFSLLVGMSPGREAYPGDIFYIHSRLLERSGCFNEKYHNGTITSLPIVETQMDVITNYIETNIISISDGQIVTSTELKNKRFKPSIDIGQSVSRVGSSARLPILNKEVASFKNIYAQYVDLKDFVTTEDALPKNQKLLFTQGKVLEAVFMQENNNPQNYMFTWLISVLFNEGLLMLLAPEDIKLFKGNLLAFIKQDDFAYDLINYVYKRKSYRKLTHNIKAQFSRDVVAYYILQTFAPLVKKFANEIYKKNKVRLNAINLAFLEYNLSPFKIIKTLNDDLISTKITNQNGQKEEENA